MTGQDVPSSAEYDDDSSSHSTTKKREWARLATRAEIKKTKCDGKKPCGLNVSATTRYAFSPRSANLRIDIIPWVTFNCSEELNWSHSRITRKIIYLSLHLSFFRSLQVEDRENIPINEVILDTKEGLWRITSDGIMGLCLLPSYLRLKRIKKARASLRSIRNA